MCFVSDWEDHRGVYCPLWTRYTGFHYRDVIISTMASKITGVSIVYATVCSGADHKKHQSSASLAFGRGTHRWPVNSPHKGPVTRKIFPFDDVIMQLRILLKPKRWTLHIQTELVPKEHFLEHLWILRIVFKRIKLFKKCCWKDIWTRSFGSTRSAEIRFKLWFDQFSCNRFTEQY